MSSLKPSFQLIFNTMEKNHYDVILTSKKSIYFVNSKLTHMKTHTHMLIKFVFKGKKIYLHFLNDSSTW